MKQHNFKDENLHVDWIGLNCKELKPSEQNRIAEFLSKYKFNSTIVRRVNDNWETEKLVFSKNNKYNVEFRQYDCKPEIKSYWIGTKINFTGKNAERFYNSTRTESEFFSTLNLEKATLARLDICLNRPNKENENNQMFQEFLQACQSDLLNKYKKNLVKLDRNKQGFILTIGSRQSTKFLRVYQKETEIRFELEIKNKDQYLKSIQSLWFQNSILDFESHLTNYFYLHLKKVLNLKFFYTDWLVRFFQKKRYNGSDLFFVTSYFEDSYTLSTLTNDIKKSQQLYRLLQFLSFSQTQASTSIEIESHKYQVIKFKVQDFMKYIKVENDNKYQTDQLVKFFRALTTTQPLVKVFSEHKFQISATVPFVAVDDTSGFWEAKVWLRHELYSYRYPFSFPEYYLSYQDNYDLQVKLQITQSFANAALRKKFNVQEFLKRFQNVPNKKKAHIKKLIVLNLKALFNQKLIQKSVTLTVLGNKRKNKARIKKTQQIQFIKLTPLLIGKTHTLYYFETI